MLGPIIGAAGNLLGGIFGQNAADKAADKNIKLQKDFAQKGIQWKVADAIKAGLHPLAALGANTMSFSPVATGDVLGPSLDAMGQNLGRAVDATKNTTEKMQGAIAPLLLEKAGLENDLLRSQIHQLNKQPAMPTDGGINNIIPGQASSATITTAQGEKIKVPAGMTPGQEIENWFGESGEPINMYNMWTTVKRNPAPFAAALQKMGYSITPFGAAQQFMPEKWPFKKRNYGRPNPARR